MVFDGTMDFIGNATGHDGSGNSVAEKGKDEPLAEMGVTPSTGTARHGPWMKSRGGIMRARPCPHFIPSW